MTKKVHLKEVLLYSTALVAWLYAVWLLHLPYVWSPEAPLKEKKEGNDGMFSLFEKIKKN